MAPLPQNNTARLWVDYNDGENDHSLQVRFLAPDTTLAIAMTYAGEFFEAIEDFLYEITINGARFAAAGSDISLPATWSGASTYGTDPMPTLLAPRETRWVGRTQNGRRVSFSVYGCKYTSPDTFRIVSDGANLPNLGVVLINDASDDGAFVAIDGFRPTMKNYVDVNFNSYWEAEART
jgi:hypothetical protein